MHNHFYAVFLSAGFIFLTPFLSSVVEAKRFTPEQCNGLRQLRQELEMGGVGKIVTKGAEWAAENLNTAQLSEVGAYLKLGEEIQFRCSKSTIGRKQKSKKKARIPLPIRNPRRKLQELAKKAALNAPAVMGKANKDLEMSPEEKSVLSVVTDKKTKATAEKLPGLTDKGLEK